ncbi:DnaB-like helicase N-terminal domain-containing protein [Dyella sp. 2HG41-7]|uniref:DnaB-like helicase N-terminal domain-containing protein n=1 Tax=Dyella sp. 2HG41-7 TaxID=2883239 RepID=UPI001F1E49D4|nr:DnaB-like helicase N-terminal domain-containing protein [Dyella sp. 2HG41-7]
MSAARNDIAQSTRPRRRMLTVATTTPCPDALRELPCSIDAEQAVLGALMIQPSALAKIKDWLQESDFFRRDHQAIYRAMSVLIDRGDAVDAITLGDWFETNGLTELTGGRGYLIELDQATASAANIVGYAEIVAEKSRLRSAVDIGERLAAAALQGTEDPQALLIQARADVDALSARHTKLNPIAAALSSALAPFSAQEFSDAATPHPHAFQAADVGLFPVGEVTLIAAQGREGKTFCEIGFAAAFARNKPLVGLTPAAERSVIIYSAEDDRRQYARKVAAQRWLNGEGEWTNRIIVPDLNAPGVMEWRELVRVTDRRPEISPAVDAIIASIQPLMSQPGAPGLLIFETASTLTQADEDNAGHKTLIAALRKIARTLEIAVVLVHHTSQAATANLPTLNLATIDIRGATALTANSRQCLQLVNLGSDEDPHPGNDARTQLRELVAPSDGARISVLICLDSSKAIDPPPVFFKWHVTPYGPALKEFTPPASVEGKRWRKVREMLSGKRADARADAKDAETAAKVDQAVEAVRKLQRENKPASARAVSLAAGKATGWAVPYLFRAVDEGRLATKMAKIPRTSGETPVYFIPSDSWEGDK